MNWSRAIAVGTTAGLAAACMLPAVWINAELRLSQGGHYGLLVGAVASVVIAAVAAGAIALAVRRRDFGMAATAALLFLVALAFNLSNAVGNASVSRDGSSGARKAEAQRVALLRGKLSQGQAQLSQLTAATGGKTAGMLEGEIRAKQHDPLFERSRQCTDATALPSRALCAEIAMLSGQLSAAHKAQEVGAGVDRVTAELAAVRTDTSNVDPQIRTLTWALGLVFTLGDDAETRVAFGYDVLFGVLVELLAAMGPAVVAYVLMSGAGLREPAAPKKREDADAAAVAEPPAVAREPEVVKPAVADAIGRFVEERLNRVEGACIRAGELYSAYAEWSAKVRVAAENPTRFGLRLGELGLSKERIGNRVRYLNVEVAEEAPARPALRVAVDNGPRRALGHMAGGRPA